IRAAMLLALVMTFGLAAPQAPAAELPELARGMHVNVVSGEASSQFIPLGVGKSVVVDLPRDIKDGLSADPQIAHAVIQSTPRAYISGAKVGQTSVFFFDAEGAQIGGFDIAVTRDLNGLRAAIKQALQGLDIRVEGLGEGVVITGNVAS